MSMSLVDVKKDNSSRRQRDVIELIFTCEMLMFLLCSCTSPELVEEGEGGGLPTEAARRPEPVDGNIGRSSATGSGAAVGGQQTIIQRQSKQMTGQYR